MIDIFDIIGDQKNIHINIEGEVSADGYLFDIEYINELSSLLLDNQKDVEFKIFNVKEFRDTEPLLLDRGMYGYAYTYERNISFVEFSIDAYITNRLYDKLDNSMRDFIDYFTKGAIVYPIKKGANQLTFDAHEEYMSSPLDEVGITVPSALDYMFSWEKDNNEWSGIGSYPIRDRINRVHDADGDVHTARFASRLMGIPNGREPEIDPADLIGRPVRGGNF